MQTLPAFWTHAAQLRISASMRRVWGLPPLGWMPSPSGQALCYSCGGNHTANYRGCVKWKEAKAAIAKRAPVLGSKNTSTSNLAAPNATQAGPSAERMDLSEGWSHVVLGGRVVKATTPPTIPNHQPVTEASEQPHMTAASKTAKPKKPAPRPAAAAKATSAKPTKKASASVKTVAAKTQSNNLVVTPQHPVPSSRTSLISSTTYPSRHVWS
jgi:hypothetical protein